MIPFIKKYAKGIIAAIGYIASIATALGLQHQHYVAIILGVLSTIAVVLAKNTDPAPRGGGGGTPVPAPATPPAPRASRP